jgi:membrane-associated phospholipid phosphatase
MLAPPGEAVLHRNPPTSPARVLVRHRLLVPLALALAALAAAAAIDASPLLAWDEPIRRFVTAHRADWLDRLFSHLSDLGGPATVAVGAALVTAVAWRRCYLLAGLVAATMLARPGVVWALKAVVDRPRPAGERLVHASSPSFPSGHTLSAVAVWGLVPPVVALLTRRRLWWWMATALSGLVIAAVAASRVYLGAHWFSDVVAGAAVGCLLLLVAEQLLAAGHRSRPCAAWAGAGDRRRC